ncbi:peptidase S9 prolyl oligopeptidase active site domain-containing protein [Natrialba hulunbeirensis JCM 10989]|uniref:Peptidase S9 prolyl oligopeptidase active site domain-containing protein n=1 Tax=Natrialba hulunbeirensis JCM 10989 TaxID=1227493 RepID=L9ZYG7_9EURY|nr:S9 family peptidase [Natrialba hulunbeirensis]ELY91364.1 peptidase S9 prolyl oligopeptidase active site domain-containing protein [Natrialba hulunbeirensis JCM 10989]
MNTIEATDFYDLRQVSDPQLSPGGERVAYVEQLPEDEESSEATIHVVPVGGGEPTQLTITEGVDSQPRWSPDGDRLAFASTRGEDDDRQQLWVLPTTTGGEARQLTSVVGGITGLEWSPDGSRLLFTQQVTAADREEGRDLAVDPEYEPETPDPRVIDRMIYRAGTEYMDGRRSHVYVLDLEAALESDPSDPTDTDPENMDAIERLTDGDEDHSGATWGDDETVYYAVTHAEAGVEPDDSLTYDLFEHDLESGEATAVTQTTGWVTELEATTDGRIAYAFTPEEQASIRQTDVRVHDCETGTETTPTASLDRTIDGNFTWAPDEEMLYFTTPDEGAHVLWSVDVPTTIDNGEEAIAEPTRVYGDDVTVAGFSVGDNAVALVQSEWDHPGDVFVTTRGGNETHRLTRVNGDLLADRAVRQPEEIWFERGDAGIEDANGDGNSDGDGNGNGDGNDERNQIQGWLLTPPEFDADAASGPDETYPLVVEIHGGPHAQWTTAGTMWHEFQTLAAQGYVVFWCNPRGSTGYGEDHAMAIERNWGDVTLSDVLAGVDEVCERDFVDEDELFVTGGSFGGFMTSWAVTQTDRFTAAVSQRGVYDLTSFYGSTDAFKLIEGDFDTTPWEEPEFLWEQSPAAHVPNVETPTLVLHSDRDYRTPANTAELFYLGLKKHGVDTRLVRYPREGHELSRSGEPGHVVDRLERIVRWFDGYADSREVAPALKRDRDAGLSGGLDESDNGEDESASENELTSADD